MYNHNHKTIMNKKYHQKITLVLALFSISLFLSNGLLAQDRSIKFEDTAWQQILDKAKKENKLIFMDAYTTWCGPCKKMAKNTFTQNEVADFFNNKFVNAKFDMEKGEGQDLAKKYNVRAYPTLLFIDGNGEKVHFALGYMDGKQLIAKAKAALDDKNNYQGMTKRYKAGNLSADFISRYSNLLKDGYMPYEEVLQKYWASQKDFLNKENWEMIKEFEKSPESARYKYVVENQKKYLKKYGQKEVYDYIAAVHFTGIYQGMRKGKINKDNYSAEIEKVKKLNIPNKGQVIAQSDILYYQYLNKDMSKAADAMVVLVEKYKEDSPSTINSYAWTIYEHIDDKTTLSKAANWMKKIALPKERDAAYLDTYAALLYKLGKYSEGLKFAEEAVSKAKANGESTDDYEKTLAMIKAKL